MIKTIRQRCNCKRYDRLVRNYSSMGPANIFRKSRTFAAIWKTSRLLLLEKKPSPLYQHIYRKMKHYSAGSTEQCYSCRCARKEANISVEINSKKANERKILASIALHHSHPKKLLFFCGKGYDTFILRCT